MAKTYKLENILDLKSYMKIAIDEKVEKDADGNYLVNFGYLRVSTDKQADEGYGLDVQEKTVIKCCQTEELKNLVLFIDDGYTGTKMERPALDAIVRYITSYNEGRSNIRVNSLVVPKIDRLGRTLLGTLQFIQDYILSKAESKHSTVNNNREEITFYSADEKHLRVEPNNPQSKFLLTLFAGLAEFDRDLIVQKLKRGMIARVEDGYWPGGGNIPYGYSYNQSTGILEIIPEEAEKIREIFRLYIEEKIAPQKIADRLGFKGDRIVTEILKRKSLTGCIIYKGKEYRGRHEAIISLSRWKEAQDELEKRSRHRAESNYLLSGLLVCGECGAKMRYQKWNKDGDCKLICYSQQKSKPNLVKSDDCQNERYWAVDIENAVISELFRMTYLGDKETKKQVSTFDPIAALKKEIEIAKAEHKRLIDYYAKLKEDQDDEILEATMQESNDRIKSLNRQLNDEEEKAEIMRKVEKAKNIFRTLDSAWGHMTDKEKQSVCQELIDRIEIHKDGVVDVHLKLRSYLIRR